MRFSKQQINALRERVRASMSEFRFVHTAEVEKMATRISELYAPDKTDIVRVAALLHDITKEKGLDEQIEMLERGGEKTDELDRMSYKTLHARTAVYTVRMEYPEFAECEVLSAIRYHTTGRADMSLTECIVFLADYIDMSRKFEDCVYLRNYFWDAEPENMSQGERLEHLWRTIVLAFDLTLRALSEEGSPISVESVEARNSFIVKLNK
ncbi:MAG: bis(5'-nucleosyl)-tetraphosphatase (symmetrical) YqeK [Clostridia bacterium]|nr:bis(5'-nucleosyl)-tetraphosphatase (symmetrical) YqeK [Clostridia bacterium]